MLVKCFSVPGLSVHSYLIYDEKSHQGIIIDPTRQIEVYVEYIQKEHITIKHILETHVHADFISGAVELKNALPQKPIIHCSGMGGQEWIPSYADHVVMDRDTIHIGSIRLEALHTPGHTPEHLIWIAFDEERSCSIPALAFTGDLLFVGSVGRPDLLGEEHRQSLFKQLYHSLFAVMQSLPEFIEIYPAHGSGSLCGKSISSKSTSTLGYEKRCNPWMIPQEFKKWQNLLQDISAPPPYFQWMKKINITGATPLSNAQELIIDVRNSDTFAKGHLKGAINVPLSPTFIQLAGVVIPNGYNLTLVVNTQKEAQEVAQALRLISTNPISKVIEAKDCPPQNATQLPSITAEELLRLANQYQIIDVRTPAEWKTGTLPQAHLIELTRICEILQQFPKETPLALICRSGARSSTAASVLIHEGFHNVVSVRGGMQAILLLKST